MKKKSCSERLQEAMVLRNMKQVDLINATDIKKSALSQYVSGKILPRQNNIYKLAKALNVNEAWLMGYDVGIERNSEDEKNSSLPSIKRFRLEELIQENATFFNDESISNEDKKNLLEKIIKYFRTNTSDDEILDFLVSPPMERFINQVFFDNDLLTFLQKDRKIFNFLSFCLKIFVHKNLPKEKKFLKAFNLSEENIEETLKDDLKKYRFYEQPEEESEKILRVKEQIIKKVENFKAHNSPVDFDISYSNGKTIEFKKINSISYAFIFNINDNPIKIKKYRLPFGDELDFGKKQQTEFFYKEFIENGVIFFNNENISMEVKEKAITELQEEFFKVKFNINKK